MRKLLASVLVSVAFGQAQGQAQEWPRFRGPDSDGHLEGTGRFDRDFGLSVTWQREFGSAYSGIAVAEGALVTLFSDGTSDLAIALDPATGDERWRSVVEPTYRGHDGSHDGSLATPLIAEGRVFALGAWGRFVAFDLSTGEELWSHHLRDEFHVDKPFWGFASSPIFEGGRVLLQVGGDVGTLAAFAPDTGRLLWAVGRDGVDYQSASVDTERPERRVLAAGREKILAVDPRKGEVRWEHVHEGNSNQGALSLSPVPVGPDAFFLSHAYRTCQVFEVGGQGETLVTQVRWEESGIRNSYNVPVHHDGHVYGFSSRFLTAVDTTDGSTKWKSRLPGDGFLIVVDGQLVILTKTGTLAVGEASPEGFETAASVDLFEDLAWTAPSFADGSIFVRSLSEIARVDVVPVRRPATTSAQPLGLMASLASSVAAADRPAEIVDRFLDAHPERPILEGELVHFVYRGSGTDVALGGDLLGARREEPMTRLADTNLFYYTARIPAGTRINYVFIHDYKTVLDPGNPRTVTSFFMNAEMEPSYGRQTLEMSWMATPPWAAPSHVGPLPDGATQGRLIEHEDPGLKVWVPAGYAESEKRYPVAYVDGSAALERGGWSLALDHLVGDRVEEMIVVFVDWPGKPHADYPTSLETYSSHYEQIVVPFVDASYRTEARAGRRALVGMGVRGFPILALAIERQELFGNVGVQSIFVYSPGLGGFGPALNEVESRDLKIYLDWATYDLRNPHENWDIGTANRRIAEGLRSRGFPIAGGEVADGLGWANWRQRTDDLLEALFPLP